MRHKESKQYPDGDEILVDELKPCPFCGVSDVHLHVFEYQDDFKRDGYGCQAICSNCGARLESNMGDVREHTSPQKAKECAIKRWQTRF